MNYILGLTIIGIISGLFAGLIGGGAEILIVPLLTLFGLLGSLKNRIGTSLFMLLPPIGIFAAIKFYKKGHVDIFAGLYMGLIFTIFSLISSNYTLQLNRDILRKFFAIFTILAGGYMFFDKE
jgi:uncharacterized membrane protein YfcA|tara:strand:- start:309 stop:677 length:369 start_codon:yes stop_codon:yes gene_type:complete